MAPELVLFAVGCKAEYVGQYLTSLTPLPLLESAYASKMGLLASVVAVAAGVAVVVEPAAEA